MIPFKIKIKSLAKRCYMGTLGGKVLIENLIVMKTTSCQFLGYFHELLAHNWYIETISTRNSRTLLNSSHYPLYVSRGLETEKRCLIDFSG